MRPWGARGLSVCLAGVTATLCVMSSTLLLLQRCVSSSHAASPVVHPPRSVFYLPPPRALNYLLDTSRKPVLVFQGALDPLNDARGRAAALKNACRVADVQVELVEAGHCPMDEVPDTFNASMLRFVQRVVDARVMA